MPFTPFHFGPGLFIKSLARKFSLTLFAFSQIVIDLEPLYFMLTHNPPVHRWLHTFLGSNLAVVISAVIGKPLCEMVLHIASKIIRTKQAPKISWPSAIWTSIIGAYSHVFFDSLMHRDMRPFNPFSQTNPLLGLVNIQQLYEGCFWTGVLGILIYVFLKRPENSSK